MKSFREEIATTPYHPDTLKTDHCAFYNQTTYILHEISFCSVHTLTHIPYSDYGMSNEHIKTFRENGCWNIAVGHDKDGKELIISLDPARPVKLTRDYSDLIPTLLPVLLSLDDEIEVSLLQAGRYGFSIEDAPKIYEILQSLVNYELVQSNNYSLTKLKKLSMKKDTSLSVVIIYNLEHLLKEYGVIATILLKEIKNKNCFIIASYDGNEYKEFADSFFKIKLDCSDYTFYEAAEHADDFNRLLNHSIVKLCTEDQISSLSMEEQEDLIFHTMIVETDREIFRDIIRKSDKTLMEIDKIIIHSVEIGPKWMLEEVLDAGLRFKKDAEESIYHLMIYMSSDRYFKYHIDVLKKYYPEWFSSPFTGFYLLYCFLKNAFHNDGLVIIGTEEYDQQLDEIKSDMFSYLLSQVHPESPYGHDEDMRTLLDAAIMHSEKKHKLFSIICDLGINVNTIDEWGRTPLFSAAEYDDPFMAEKIISEGAEVNCRDVDGNTPLFNASYACTKLLLEKGADPSLMNEEHHTPLMHFIYEYIGKENELERLLVLAEHYDESLTDEGGRNSFMAAAYAMVFEEKLFDKLLERTKDINMKDNEGKTLLFYIIENIDRGESTYVEKALAAGADPFVILDNGRSAIHSLAGRNMLDRDDYIKLIRMLPESIREIQDNDGNTALHLAVMNNELQLIIALLLTTFDSRDARNKDGKTPYELATGRWQTKIKKYFRTYFKYMLG